MKKTPRWMKGVIEAAKGDVPSLPKGLGQPITRTVIPANPASAATAGAR